MATQRKQVTFDLDTKALQKYYPSDNWRYAYEVIKKHMQKNGFSWQEGSVYVSDKPMAARTVSAILTKLVNKNPWLNVCMRDCRQANIGREHSQNYLFDKTAAIPHREELNKSKTMEKWQKDIQARKADAEAKRISPKQVRGQKRENER